MSVLTREVIQQELEAGNVKFDPPVSPDQISVASIDLHLSNKFRVFRVQSEAIAVKEDTDYINLTREVTSSEFVLRPQETVLGITVEKVTLPDNILGWLEGRSRFARLGLLIHISAGLVQPGVSNHQVLEITNLGPNSLVLHAGERICQLILQRCEGRAKYEGKFSDQ